MDRANTRLELSQDKFEEATDDLHYMLEAIGYTSEQDRKEKARQASNHRVGGWVGAWVGRCAQHVLNGDIRCTWTRATIEVHHFFSNTTLQVGSLRPHPKTDLENNKPATG